MHDAIKPSHPLSSPSPPAFSLSQNQAQRSPDVSGKPVFPALPRLSRRGSTHTTVERGTDLWETLVVKRRGKATDPFLEYSYLENPMDGGAW